MKIRKHTPGIRSLSFSLDVEDGWPPVATESLPFEVVSEGLQLKVPPLYVKDLSVGDILTVRERAGEVNSWKHVHRSGNSTVWLLRLKADATLEIERVLTRARALGCKSSGAQKLGSYALDVPEKVSLTSVDALLEELDDSRVAVAYPSLRH